MNIIVQDVSIKLDTDPFVKARSQPTAQLPEVEANAVFEELCNALILYGDNLGYRVDITSVTYHNRHPSIETTATNIAALRLAVYKAICAHGLQKDHDNTTLALLHTPKYATD